MTFTTRLCLLAISGSLACAGVARADLLGAVLNATEKKPAATQPAAKPSAGEKVADGLQKAQTAGAIAANATQPATAPATAPATQPALSAATQAQADTLLAQATKYIKEHKVELAEQVVSQLDGLRPALPASYGPKIDFVKNSLATLKASNFSLPGFGK